MASLVSILKASIFQLIILFDLRVLKYLRVDLITKSESLAYFMVRYNNLNFEHSERKMSRQFFEQQNMIPHSLSAISNIPDISSASFTRIFEQRKSKQDISQYKVKVKKAQFISNKNTGQIGYPIKIAGQKSVNYELQLNQQQQHQPSIQAEQIPLREDITGYQICKTSFSEQEIIEAFKVIDINKDQVITQEDIIFFLQYIKQPYTKEQVREMIQMVSSDKKKVTFQDFKKIGKGSIIPFADIRIPDEQMKHKKVIYKNIKNNQSLYNQDPSILVNASKNDIISLKKFEESKKASKNSDYESMKIIDEQEQLQFLIQKIALFDEEQFQLRKDTYSSIQMVNVGEVTKNYNQLLNSGSDQQHKYLTYKQIAKLLEISQKQAKSLYGDKRSTLAKRVVLQAIAFSPLNKIKRLQVGMMVMFKKKTINFNQIYFLLQILRGKDDNQFLKKKLLTLLRSKNISTEEQIDKFYALQLISNYSFNFNF